MPKQHPQTHDIDRAFSEAKSRFSAGDFKASERLLKQIISTAPAHAGAYYYLGRLANSTGYTDHAVPLLQEALRLEPENPDYVEGLVKQLISCGKHSDAAITLQHGLARCPANKQLLKLESQLSGDGGTATSSAGRRQAMHDAAAKEDYEGLLALARLAIADDEADLETRYYYGMALLYTGSLDEAVQQLRVVVRLDKKNDEAWGQLGVAYMHKGMGPECIAAHHTALTLKPGEHTHHINMGVAQVEFNNLELAEKYAKEAVSLKGNSVPAIALLGRVASKRWEYDKARKLLKKALELRPGFKSAMASLVEVLLAEGKLQDTEWEARKLIALHPDASAAYNTLVDALTAQEKLPQALEIAELGVSRFPEEIALQNRLGICLNNLKRFEECLEKYNQILAVAPDYFPARLNAAGSYSLVGEHEMCSRYYRHALASGEAKPEHFSSWIFSHLYNPEASAEEILDISRNWGVQQHGNAFRYNNWNVSVEEDVPLRIGIVSGDFRNHPVGFFLESVLRKLQERGVEIFLYSTVLTEDSNTEEFKKLANQWHRSYKDSPDALAQKVHEDGVNILIDVAGHTAHNRLAVFARKPAPVQITWLGYLSTSGLDTMDYIIGDPWVTPKGEEHHFVEEPLVLPRSYQCLSKPTDSPEVAPLPALENGYITFGTFNNYAKLNEHVLDLWAEVLKAVDGSRLLIKNQVLTDAAYQNKMRENFVSRGVEAERLAFEPSRSREHLLESYGRLDIGLDPFPYTGCTTSFESLWMGVPVITRKGNRFLSHAGESIMNNLDMPDWIANDADEYIRVAVEKTADLDALAETRASLRQRIEVSPLMDADLFADDFFEALQSAWQRWRQDQKQGVTA